MKVQALSRDYVTPGPMRSPGRVGKKQPRASEQLMALIAGARAGRASHWDFADGQNHRDRSQRKGRRDRELRSSPMRLLSTVEAH